MPDGTDVSFPDDMPKEQIRGMIAKKFPEVAGGNEPGALQQAADVAAAYTDARTFGLGPKIASAIGTLPAKLGAEAAELVTGNEAPSIGEIYKSGVDMYSAPGRRAAEHSPWLSAGATIAGAVKTGKALGGTKTAQNLGQLANKGGPLGRAALAAGTGEAGYRASKVGAAETGEELEALTTGTPWGAITGGGLSLMGSGVRGVRGAMRGKVADVSKIDDMARAAYDDVTAKGGTLKAQFSNDLLDELDKMKPQGAVSGDVLGDSAFTRQIAKLQAMRNRPLSIIDVQELDEGLSEAVDAAKDGGAWTKQAQKISDIQRVFRKMVDKADSSLVQGGKEGFDALKRGRELWHAKTKIKDLLKIIDRAEMTDNPAGSLRTQMKNLLLNDKRIAGYSEQERKAIEEIARGGPVQDLLRTFGSRFLGILPAASANPVAAAAGTGVAKASRTGAEALQLGRADKIVQGIAARAGADPMKMTAPPQDLSKLLMATQLMGRASQIEDPAQQQMPGLTNLLMGK